MFFFFLFLFFLFGLHRTSWIHSCRGCAKQLSRLVHTAISGKSFVFFFFPAWGVIIGSHVDAPRAKPPSLQPVHKSRPLWGGICGAGGVPVGTGVDRKRKARGSGFLHWSLREELWEINAMVLSPGCLQHLHPRSTQFPTLSMEKCAQVSAAALTGHKCPTCSVAHSETEVCVVATEKPSYTWNNSREINDHITRIFHTACCSLSCKECWVADRGRWSLCQPEPLEFTVV